MTDPDRHRFCHINTTYMHACTYASNLMPTCMQCMQCMQYESACICIIINICTCTHVCMPLQETSYHLPDVSCPFPFFFVLTKIDACVQGWMGSLLKVCSSVCAKTERVCSKEKMGSAWRSGEVVALFVACILPTMNTQRPKRTRVCLSDVCFGLSRHTYTCPFMYYGN